MKTLYRNSDLDLLTRIREILLERGISVAPIVVPENAYVDGPPYFSTDGSNQDVYDAWRQAARGWSR